MEKSQITCQEAGKKGGQKCAANHDSKFYADIGRKGGLAKKKKVEA